MQNNQKSYPAKGWPAYGDGMEIPSDAMKANMVPITDWVPGQEPAWAPLAGGKGFGTPERSTGPPPALWPGKSTALARGGSARGGGGTSNSTTNNITGPYSNSTANGMSLNLNSSSALQRADRLCCSRQCQF